MRRHSLPTVLALAGLCAAARADVITLTNGRVIEADRSWYEGSQLRYEKNGGAYGLPKSLVKSVEKQRPAEATGDPDVARARQRLAARDPVQATRLLRAALARDPHSVPALHALSEAYLALGDARAAKETAERALRIDTRDARARELMGDALVGLGDREGAEQEYRRSLLVQPDAAVERKLQEVAPAPAAAASGPGAQFTLRYDGSVNQPMGTAVLDALSAAYSEYSRRFGVPAGRTDLGRAGDGAAVPGRARARLGRRRQRRRDPRGGARPRQAQRRACCRCCATSSPTPSWWRGRAATARPGCTRASPSGWRAATPRARTPWWARRSPNRACCRC